MASWDTHTPCLVRGGVSAPVYAGINPPVDRMTDASENITL